MHEAYLAECVLRQVKESLPTNVRPEEVTNVALRVGQLDAVMHEALSEMFNLYRSSFKLSNAKLTIEQEAVSCRCKDCDAHFSLDAPVFVCPHCFGCRVQVMRGRGITLMEITVSETEHEDTHHS